MIEDIFLAYANNPLKGRPENLHTIFCTIEQNLEIDLSGIEEPIDIICELSKFSDAENILSVAKKKDLIGDGIWTISCNYILAVTGGRHSYYLQKNWHEKHPEFLMMLDRHDKPHIFDCSYREMNKNLLGEDLCEESFKIKCYECFQLDFIQTLNAIVQGKEYSEIEDFETTLSSSSILSMQEITPRIEKQNQKAPFKERLQGYKRYTMSWNEYATSVYGNSHHTFNEYLYSITCLSLTEFLLHNDRRKLKLCPYCDKFFIANDIRRQRCYQKNCKKAFQREKKRKQRNEDPIKYM